MTLAGSCSLVILPTVVLRNIGSFLKTYECFVAVRTCKNNDGLKLLLTSVTKIQIIGEDVLSGFLLVIEPSLISIIGCSLKVLEVHLNTNSAGALVKLLPRLGSLQQLEVCLVEPKEMKLLEQVFPSIPHGIRCLTLRDVDAEGLRYLEDATAAGCLPLLEELAFPLLNVRTVEDMAGLQTALMAPSFGKNLKKLFLDFPGSHMDVDEARAATWRLLESVLALEDQKTGVLSRLETLVLSGFNGWDMLAEYLLPAERLPGLKEVYSPDHTDGKFVECEVIAWYEMDAHICRSWFDLLYHRPLQSFNGRISSDGISSDAYFENGRIQEFFRCLCKQALESTCMSALKEIDLFTDEEDILCSTTFEVLAGAMRSGNLFAVESMILFAATTCTPESLISFGKALDPVLLPDLTSLFIRMADAHDPNVVYVDPAKRAVLLKSLFGSVPTGGLDKLKMFELHMPSPVTGILLSEMASVKPNCFRYLPEVCFSEVRGENIEELASIFEAGIFPSVERLKISGSPKDLGEGMPRLLRALSDFSLIKELHVEEYRDDYYPGNRQFARFMLESMLTSLSGSTSPALFPSLQILKVTTACYDAQPVTDYIEPLLSSIKPVRPPNLKTMILNDKRI